MYTALITFFLVAITVSFLCSLWEAVLLSITPSYAQIKVREGAAIGTRLQSFKADIDRPLVAILTLNTIAHTVGAIGVGEQAAKIWAEVNPLITSFIVPAGMTLAVLVLSEIIPKTLGANYWQELAPFTVNSLALIILALFPLVWMSQILTRALKRKSADHHLFTRSDFMAMAEIGADQGVLEENETQILRNLLRFRKVEARHVMTPRTVVHMAPSDMSIRDFFAANKEVRFSRIPLHRPGDRDHVEGYILRQDLLANLVETRGREPISVLRREVMVVHGDFKVTDLFNLFIERREHIAVVVDEFGSVAGIVTMEDVIETVLGMEIVDELDGSEDMQTKARRAWERRAQKMGLIESSEDQATVVIAGEVSQSGEPK